jgi:hypothetical protein
MIFFPKFDLQWFHRLEVSSRLSFLSQLPNISGADGKKIQQLRKFKLRNGKIEVIQV